MSCLYCGGENCGGSGGGPAMCEDHPDQEKHERRGVYFSQLKR